jgi:hypothetical protein
LVEETRRSSAKPAAALRYKKRGAVLAEYRRKQHGQEETLCSRQSLIAPAKVMFAHAKGEIELDAFEVKVPPQVDVTAIRKRFGLSQAEFARRFGFSPCAVQAPVPAVGFVAHLLRLEFPPVK